MYTTDLLAQFTTAQIDQALRLLDVLNGAIDGEQEIEEVSTGTVMYMFLLLAQQLLSQGRTADDVRRIYFDITRLVAEAAENVLDTDPEAPFEIEPDGNETVQ